MPSFSVVVSRHFFARIAVTAFLFTSGVVALSNSEISANGPSPFDSTYATDGRAELEIPLQKSETYVTAISPSGNGGYTAVIAANQSYEDNQVVVARYLSDGSADSSFGTNGRSALFPLKAPSMVIQNDGKIVLAGYSMIDLVNHVVAYRLMPNGAIDTTFGVDGRYKQNAFPGRSFSGEVSVDFYPDADRIVLGFELVNANQTNANFAFIALTERGRPDSEWGTFGGAEVVPNPTSASAWSSLHSIRFMSNGSLIALGASYEQSSRQIVLIMFTSGGALDTDFDGPTNNANGMVKVDFGNQSEAMMSGIHIQQDGGIMLAGFAGTYNTGPWYYGFAKFLSTGELDTTFGSNGFALSSQQSEDEFLLSRSLAQVSSGEFIFPITAGTSSGFIRVEEDGTFDSSQECWKCLWSPPGLSPVASALAVLSDAKILVGGRVSSTLDAVTVRFLASGTVDSSIPSTTVVLNLQNWNSVALESIRQSDGSVITLTDSVLGEDSSPRPVIFKTLSNGSLDLQFGDGGYKFLRPPDTYINLNTQDIAVQPDGKFVVLATANEWNVNESVMMWRVNPDGSIDNSFGNSGVVRTIDANDHLRARSLVISPDSKIYVAVDKIDYVSITSWIYRYHSTGALDTSYTDSNNFAGAITPTNSSNETLGPIQILKGAAGEMYVFWQDYINSITKSHLIQLTSNGSINQSFAGGRLTWTYDDQDSLDYLIDLVVTPDNKITILGVENQPTERSVLLQFNSDGTVNSNFGTAGKTFFGMATSQQAHSEWSERISLTPTGYYVVGSGTVTRSWDTRFFAVAKFTSSGILDTTFANSGLYQDFASGNTEALHIEFFAGETAIISGVTGRRSQFNGWLRKLDPAAFVPATTQPPVTSPPMAAPPVTAPPVTTPPTTIAPSVTTANDDIKLVITVTQAAILKRMKLSVPRGSKVSMRVTTPKVCRVVKTRVQATSTGTCRVSVTLTDKKKKKTTKTTSFRVT